MYELCDMGYWAVIEKQSGKIIGRVGIEPKIWNQGRSVVELGYLIDEAYQRQGYGYEACHAILLEAKERGAKYLYCRIHSENKSSIALAKTGIFKNRLSCGTGCKRNRSLSVCMWK